MIKLALVLSVIVSVMRVASGQAASGRTGLQVAPPVSTAVFSLDGVTLELTTSFLSDLTFATSDPDSAIQMATAGEREPLLRQLSITAVPFGASPPMESLPSARPGLAKSYRAALKAYRERQGGDPHDGAVMRLFGEDVSGSTSIVRLRVRGENPVPVAITEWVVEAGPRLWILRASRELERTSVWRPSATAAAFPFASLALSSRDLSRPSTSLASQHTQGRLPHDGPGVVTGMSDLPVPGWWDGECDTVNFSAETGAPAYPLGAEYRAMKACGPRPWADGGPWRWVSFGPGLMSQIEWQCPELSKRFLYLAYDIPPYGANGNQMVDNYDGDLLEKVWNCTAGRAPAPDDVLSYGRYTTYGHTSVVMAADVDAAGDGTIDVIEQNSSRDGDSRLYVDNWCVESYTDVIGWLHKPDEEPTTTWLAEYFGDDHLGDSCSTIYREGTYVFEHWGGAAPAAGCPPDHFSARFSRTIDFPGGDYTFGMGYDAGARLKVGGDTLVDGWGGADQHYQTRHLEAGSHEVSVEYYHHVGDAALTVFWWGPGFELARDTQVSSQWYAEHWGNQALWWDPVVMAVDGDGPLDHQWSWGAPADCLPQDHFSSRFRRTVPLDAGRWRFDLFADDGVRFWIDDLLIADEWQPQRAWFTPTVTVGDGDYELVVEHYENEEVADIWLDWERVSEADTPTGWVTSPIEGATIDACPILIDAQVGNDVDVVDRVEFHAHYDDQWHHLGDDDSSPYTWAWDCQLVRNQTAWLSVHVWNEAGGEFVDLGGRVSVELEHLSYFYLPLILRLGAGEY
jgi:hypothetical protein